MAEIAKGKILKGNYDSIIIILSFVNENSGFDILFFIINSYNFIF